MMQNQLVRDRLDGPCHMAFPGLQSALRDGLAEVMGLLGGFELGTEGEATVEIVLAEALNNVIEHAYQGGTEDHGQIVEIELSRNEAGIAVVIRDDGQPMPGLMLPEGKAQGLDCATEDLPEGGFGWFLIRELAQNLHYLREDGRNHLSFCIPMSRTSALE